MTGAAGLIVSASDWVPVPPEIGRASGREGVPAVVGVAEVRQVVELSVRPGGSPLAPTLVGALVALRVTVEAPAVVGVPEMSPVVELSVRPAGSRLWRTVVGVLVAVI